MRKLYTIDCKSMSCGKHCFSSESFSINRCEFTGTKKQVEAFIKKQWKQPKIKEFKDLTK